MAKHLFQTGGKCPVPIIITKHETKQHTNGRSPLRREVGQVRRNEFPRDIGGICIGSEMHIFGHHVVRDDQAAVAQFNDRRVIQKPARRRVFREATQYIDEGGFGGHAATLADVPFILKHVQDKRTFSYGHLSPRHPANR